MPDDDCVPGTRTGTADGASLVYGTCVARDARAALLRGRSGSGKSDLALRFLELDASRHALVSDDQVRAWAVGDRVHVSAPPAITGLIEVRGVGILRLLAKDSAELCLVVDLVPDHDVPRLPAEPPEMAEIAGIPVPRLRLSAFEPSAPIKLRFALERRNGLASEK